ncbi:DegV family protein with EDD domain [Anaerotaenia torta]|uniref:DegV family protein n=1 Tax=Anaerotaenia torta TaxID=433293 RepID=UPI003D194691
MNNYVIVTDATLDLPAGIIDEYGIRVIPMGICLDEVEFFHYPDERELTVEDFYRKLKEGAVSRTTQITPAIFMDYFEDILKQGQDILYICFSSGLSGTYHTSQVVIRDLSENYPERRIYGIDSLCASIGEGLLVLNAAIQKKNGLDLEQLRDWVEANKRRVRHWFTVKDLFHLRRGGRLSSIEAMVGTALKIRPILSTDSAGKLTVVSKIRGSRAELEFMLNKIEEEGEDLSSQILIIGHGDDLEQAQELEKLIRSRLRVQEIIISKIGPVIGSHTGPGMLALVFVGSTLPSA